MTRPLDDLDVAAVDPDDMLATVEDTPRQWRHAVELAEPLVSHPGLARARPDSVVVAGMGGSGIAGDLAAALATLMGNVPVTAVKGYRLPAWIGPRSLVVAVSYSGNTEETLSATEDAEAAGARMVAVTSGGALADRAAAAGWPTVFVPGGRQPRASFGYLAVPAVAALVGAEVLPRDLVGHLASLGDHTDTLLENWRRDVPTDHNAVKQAARELVGCVPVFHGGRGIGALVALRGRCQVNEMASLPAFAGELPELDHNEVVGWDGPEELTGRFGLVRILDVVEEHPAVSRRFEATLAVVGSAFGATVDHTLRGDNPLQRLASGLLFVDLMAVYLALLSGVDPTPVAPIDELKRRMAASAAQDGEGAPDG